jgi:hypothetical protein
MQWVFDIVCFLAHSTKIYQMHMLCNHRRTVVITDLGRVWKKVRWWLILSSAHRDGEPCDTWTNSKPEYETGLRLTAPRRLSLNFISVAKYEPEVHLSQPYGPFPFQFTKLNIFGDRSSSEAEVIHRLAQIAFIWAGRGGGNLKGICISLERCKRRKQDNINLYLK